MRTWFTADQHFGHANIVKFCHRPFATVGEMDEALIQYWNESVGTNDIVWHLGDFCLGGPGQFASYFARLNGRVFVVPGGHDKRWVGAYAAASRPHVMPTLLTRKFSGATITLCHYPLASWEKSHYGALHLHGHCHGTIGVISRSADKQLPPGEQVGMRIDVGVDCWGFRPVLIDDLLTSARLGLQTIDDVYVR